MSPYDMAAENAAYGAAKENTGNEAQSAMKGLDAAMAARGITGSGIQAANTRGIFEKGIGEQAGTDRSLAENRSSRVFAAQQAQKQMDEMQREFNLNLSATERNQMIQALIGAAGLY
jgi:ribosomal protein L28